jgi:hypothetical protein
MDKYISGRQRQLKVGLSSYSENRTVIQTIGKVGIGTTNAEQYSLKVIGDTNIVGDLYVSDDLSIDELNARNINITGVATIFNLVGSAATISSLNVTNETVFISTISTATISSLNVTNETVFISTITTADIQKAFVDDADFERIRVAGISTFTNGPVLIGTPTPTGIPNQKLQVSGSAYVSDTVGINTESPDETLHVVGTIGVQNEQSGNHFFLQHNPVTNSLDFIYI